MSNAPTLTVGHDELAVLKLLALDGAIAGEMKASCSDLAEQLDVSTQTASRRLQRLEDAGYLTRETVTDGQWLSITDDGEQALRAEYEDYRRVFEGATTVELVGTITGGMGEGKHYISLPGYMAQFRERLAYEPFEGTLNVELTDASIRRRSAMEALEPVHIDGWEDEDRTYGPAVCYPATIEAADGERYEGAHVIAPERTHHDEDQLELIAPDRLRDELDLDDEHTVTVFVEDR
ncbi:CTP-dependent riboflavin kinase [Natranaeroarchaeum aerophilus]|uniref:Riboflavin kinase n=1 Tax=Natranaeroarchaeum aerophilus TaxID=2917711 RepID=A0AAE3FQZ8_9EURY|nr:CTP-dependent riboflavin kinase [Natranaeroarchaeum aerophilus]MCL9813699.1 CTP-dependent riboflavin kinase [Natranaeroarchaeum aerophilus]